MLNQYLSRGESIRTAGLAAYCNYSYKKNIYIQTERATIYNILFTNFSVFKLHVPFYPLNYYAPSFYQYTLLPIPYFPALINISHTWTILSSILKKGILCRWIHRDSFNFEWSNTIREIQSKHRLEKLSSSPAFYAILFRLFKRPYQINKQSSLSIGHIWFDTKFYSHFLC